METSSLENNSSPEEEILNEDDAMFDSGGPLGSLIRTSNIHSRCGRYLNQISSTHSCLKIVTVINEVKQAFSPLLDRYSLTLFDYFRPVKRPGEYFAKEWSE